MAGSIRDVGVPAVVKPLPAPPVWLFPPAGYGALCPECMSAHTEAYKTRRYDTHAWQYRRCLNCGKRYRVPGQLAAGSAKPPPESKEKIRERIGKDPYPNGV